MLVSAAVLSLLELYFLTCMYCFVNVALLLQTLGDEFGPSAVFLGRESYLPNADKLRWNLEESRHRDNFPIEAPHADPVFSEGYFPRTVHFVLTNGGLRELKRRLQFVIPSS